MWHQSIYMFNPYTCIEIGDIFHPIYQVIDLIARSLIWSNGHTILSWSTNFNWMFFEVQYQMTYCTDRIMDHEFTIKSSLLKSMEIDAYKY